MPLRLYFVPAASRWQRLSFHSSAVRWEDSANHYETLQIPTNASPGDVKKSFYKLSKTHHPDRNPNDPGASQRFVKISHAYAILSDPSKRQAYDRTHLHSSSSASSSRPGPPHHGSYSSSGPAGGRAPSGLSRRRSQFRGPPPSFYRSGGWGEHSAKRATAQEGSTRTAGEGGMGPGQQPWGRGDQNDVPHFDRERHFRTQESHEQRKRSRRAWEETGPQPGETNGYVTNFLFVSGIITLGVFVPSFLFETFVKNAGKKPEKEG